MNVHKQGAVVYNGVLMVYFVTVSLSDGLYSIGVSTSTDGMSYSDPVFCFDMRTSLDYPTADRWLGTHSFELTLLSCVANISNRTFDAFSDCLGRASSHVSWSVPAGG